MSCARQEKAQLTKDESDSTDSDSGQAPSCPTFCIEEIRLKAQLRLILILFPIVFLIYFSSIHAQLAQNQDKSGP